MTNDLHYSYTMPCSLKKNYYLHLCHCQTATYKYFLERSYYMQMYFSLKRHLLLLYTYKNYNDVKYE